MRLLGLLLATHACSCSAYSLLPARCAARRLQTTAAAARRAAVPVADERFDGFDDELDAMDTSDSWDEQLAMQEAWLAAQKKKQGKAADPEPEPDGLTVDEEAHYDFDDPDDDDRPDWREVRGGVAGQRASELSILSGIVGQRQPSPPPAAAPAAGPAADDIRVMLDAVVRTLARLEEKIDRIEEAMDIQPPSQPPDAPPSPPPAAEPTDKESPVAKPAAEAPKPSAPLAPRTMAEDEPHVDETAYMDDDPDDQDLGDWRVVRRLNNLL